MIDRQRVVDLGRRRRSSDASIFELHRITVSNKFSFSDAARPRRHKRSLLVERYIETLVVADHYLFEEFSARARNLELYILALFNMVRIRDTREY